MNGKATSRLVVSHNEAANIVRECMIDGYNLTKTNIDTGASLRRAESEKARWLRSTTDLLRVLFIDGAIASEFGYVNPFTQQEAGLPLADAVASFRKEVLERIDRLNGLLRRLEGFEIFPSPRRPLSGTDVLVTYSRDVSARNTIAQFVERLGFNTMILQDGSIRDWCEQREISPGLVVMPFTPQDSDSLRDDLSLDFAYLLGRVGRGRVLLVKRGEQVHPSAPEFVLRLSMDHQESWLLVLARRMRAAGLAFNLRQAVEV